MEIQPKNFLTILALALAPMALAQPKVDNVLIRMVPPGATSLVGARLDTVRQSVFYRELVEQRKMPQIDEFAKDTGFDPRRDVREALYIGTPDGNALVARGSFRLTQARRPGAKLVRHGIYNIWTLNGAAFCILDTTLAAAGDLKSVEAVLDEWRQGKHTAAQSLLNRMKGADPNTEFWGVSTGVANFISDKVPADFAKVFQGMEDTWFQTALATGFKAEVHGATATEQDAMRLRDAAKGLIGYGRLSVPESQPEMLKFWDSITAEQQARSITLKANIPQDLVNRAVKLLSR